MEAEEETLVQQIEQMEVTDEKDTDSEFEVNGTVFKSPTTMPMLLPENWELILKDLPPKYFLTAINTCPEWNQLMHTKKTDRLISLVFPLLMEYLSANEMIKCRCISKLVKGMIDSIFHNNPLTSPPFYEPDFEEGDEPFWIHDVNSSHSKADLIRRKTMFETVNHLRNFLDWAEPVPESSHPILSRHVSLRLGRQGVDCPPDNSHSLNLFISRFGPQIFSLSLEIRGGFHRVSVYRMFATLSHLPNLQVLRLQASIPVGELPFFPPPQALPHLPLLKSLNLTLFGSSDKVNDVPVLMPFLLRYGRQLEIFSCSARFLGSPNTLVEGLSNLLPNLKCLNTMCINAPMMMKLAMVDWKLKKLQLIQYQESRCTLVDLIRVINNFKETLVNLEMDLILNPEERLDPEEMSLLPNIKKVTTGIQNLGVGWFWDFMEESCVHLEELHWKILPDGTGSRLSLDQETQARKAFGVCPKLKKIVFWFSMGHLQNKPKVLTRE